MHVKYITERGKPNRQESEGKWPVQRFLKIFWLNLNLIHIIVSTIMCIKFKFDTYFVLRTLSSKYFAGWIKVSADEFWEHTFTNIPPPPNFFGMVSKSPIDWIVSDCATTAYSTCPFPNYRPLGVGTVCTLKVASNHVHHCTEWFNLTIKT